MSHYIHLKLLSWVVDEKQCLNVEAQHIEFTFFFLQNFSNILLNKMLAQLKIPGISHALVRLKTPHLLNQSGFHFFLGGWQVPSNMAKVLCPLLRFPSLVLQDLYCDSNHSAIAHGARGSRVLRGNLVLGVFIGCK